jgi:hypothetical protein
MFGHNSDFIPRTYSLKGYKAKKTFNLRKVFYLLFMLVIIAAVAAVAYLSMTHIV